MSADTYQLKLAVFEGPFDLLLYLIKKNQIDIYDIPITKITQEYLEYINLMEQLNLDIASEFIIIASTLIYIKAKMLLPRDENIQADEEDPRLELVQHLLEYNTFKEISEKMRLFELKKRELFERLNPLNIEQSDKELTVDMYALVKAMDSVLDRLKTRKLVVIPGEAIQIKDRIFELIDILKINEHASFFDICEKNNNRLYIVALFMGILELLRLKLIRVEQDYIYADIKIILSNRDFDPAILQNLGD
jgi:segregation and condensation protein A